MEGGIPIDIWAIVLDYALDTSGQTSTEIISLLPVGDSRLFLLCRSITAAIDEWYLLGLMERGLKGLEPTLKLNSVLKLATGLDNKTVLSLQHPKRAVLALSRAPKELLSTIRQTTGGFLCFGDERQERGDNPAKADPLRTALDVLSTSMTQLSFLDGPFLRGSPWLRTVDLQHLESLRTIGNHFLSFSSVEEALLPASLECVGEDFLFGSRISSLDLSQTALKTAGSRFLGQTTVVPSKILWPQTLTSMGDQFLYLSFDKSPAGATLDLSHTQLETLGEYALVSCTCKEILLPATLKGIGNGFLLKARSKRVDVSSVSLESIGSFCLASALVEEVCLPSSLTMVGDQFLFGVTAERITLSASGLIAVGSEFLAQTDVQAVTLPSSLKSTPSSFLNSCVSRQLDLSQTEIEQVGDFFLAGSEVAALTLPTSLKSVGTDFLGDSRPTQIEISGGSLTTVEYRFLANSKVSCLKLPSSLKCIGDEFLANTSARCMDLTDTTLELVGDYFLVESNAAEVRLPTSMASVGDSFMASCTAKRVVIQAPSLQELGDCCFTESCVEELLLPPFLKSIGNWFLGDCSATQLHIIADGLETAGEGFLSNSAIERESIHVPTCLEEQLRSAAVGGKEEDEEEERDTN